MSTALKQAKISGNKVVERRQRSRSAPGFGNKKDRKLVDGLTRSELVVKFHSKVRMVAMKIAKNLPYSVEVDDLTSVGFIGLMDAADKFDSARGVKFGTYAEFRIRGAILDELRSQDWLPKPVRAQINSIEKIRDKIQVIQGRRATDEEVAKASGISKAKCSNLKNHVVPLTLVTYGSVTEISHVENQASNPYDEASKKDTSTWMRKLFEESLTKDEQLVLACYYYRGLNLKEIGEIMSLSEARISQLHSKAILKLKEKIGAEVTDPKKFFMMLLEA